LLEKPYFYGWKFWFSELYQIDGNWKRGNFVINKLSGHLGSVWGLDVDNDFLVTAGWDNTLHCWDIITGKRVSTLRRPTQEPSNFTALSVSHGVAVSIIQHFVTLNIFNLHTKRLVHAIRVPGCERISTMSMGSEILTLANQNFHIESFSLSRGSFTRRFVGHTNSVRCMKIDEKAGILASGSLDTTIRVWDLEKGTSQILTGHRMSIICLDFSVKESILVSGSGDHKIIVWSLTSGIPIKEINIPVNVLCLSLNSNKLVTAFRNHSILVFETKAWSQILAIENLPEPVESIAHDDLKIVAAKKEILVFLFDKMDREAKVLMPELRVNPSLQPRRNSLENKGRKSSFGSLFPPSKPAIGWIMVFFSIILVILAALAPRFAF